ncbi:MAG: DUF4286 family protein [Cytophagales bacterium]|nr:DUF4286 family protein [Cytophaga sp.]
MILFNTTFNIDDSVETAWILWARDVYFTSALDSGFVLKHHLMSLRYETENSGKTFSLQLFFENDNHFEEYLKQYEVPVMEELAKRFGTNVVYFQTILDVII